MTVDRNKKLVDTEVATISPRWLTLEQLQKTIQELIESYGPDAMIQEYQYDYSDDKYLAVTVKRPESDRDYAKRIEAEERWEKQQQIRDEQEYQRLKAKFGG